MVTRKKINDEIALEIDTITAVEENEKVENVVCELIQEENTIVQEENTIIVGEKTPMMLLVEALSKARAEFDAVTKNAANPFFKSKYADLSEVIGAITPALSANGLVFVQPIEQTENGLLLRTQLLHVGGGCIESTFAIPDNKDIQKLGSAITYIRRYSLSALIGVAPQDDDGNAAAGKVTSVEPNFDECLEYVNKLQDCKTLNELKTIWGDLTQNNPKLVKALTKLKDSRKDYLMEVEKTQQQ